jgi:hypothetical protein
MSAIGEGVNMNGIFSLVPYWVEVVIGGVTIMGLFWTLGFFIQMAVEKAVREKLDNLNEGIRDLNTNMHDISHKLNDIESVATQFREINAELNWVSKNQSFASVLRKRMEDINEELSWASRKHSFEKTITNQLESQEVNIIKQLESIGNSVER